MSVIDLPSALRIRIRDELWNHYSSFQLGIGCFIRCSNQCQLQQPTREFGTRLACSSHTGWFCCMASPKIPTSVHRSNTIVMSMPRHVKVRVIDPSRGYPYQYISISLFMNKECALMVSWGMYKINKFQRNVWSSVI